MECAFPGMLKNIPGKAIGVRKQCRGKKYAGRVRRHYRELVPGLIEISGRQRGQCAKQSMPRLHGAGCESGELTFSLPSLFSFWVFFARHRFH